MKIYSLHPEFSADFFHLCEDNILSGIVDQQVEQVRASWNLAEERNKVCYVLCSISLQETEFIP